VETEAEIFESDSRRLPKGTEAELKAGQAWASALLDEETACKIRLESLRELCEANTQSYMPGLSSPSAAMDAVWFDGRRSVWLDILALCNKVGRTEQNAGRRGS
jgi:hypothetical protein